MSERGVGVAPTGDTPLRGGAHIAGIDGLRAMAVLAVVIYHISATCLPGGFAGVDVFFVISGYVVTASLLRNRSPALASFFSSFYVRRLLRIYPALLAGLLLGSIAFVLFVPAAWISGTTQMTGRWAIFGAANFALIKFDDGYFSPRGEFNVFTHTWSLGVEEQFYVLFPALLWFYKCAWDAQRARARYMLWGLAGLTMASLAYAAYETGAAPSSAYYLLPSRFWELGVGALLAIIQHRGGLSGPRVLPASMLLMLGLVLVLASFWVVRKDAFPFPWAVMPVLGTSLAIVGVCSPNAVSRLVLENRPVSYIGKISYSLYLWHWPVLVIFRWTTGLEELRHVFAAVILFITLAVASYHWLEQPVRSSAYALRQPAWKVLVTGLIVLLMTLVVCNALYRHRAALTLTVTAQEDVWMPNSMERGGQGEPTGRKLFLFGDSHAWAYTDLSEQLRADGLTPVRQFVVGCSMTALLGPASPECEARSSKLFDDLIARAKPGDVVFLAAMRTPRLGDQWATFDRDEVVRRLMSHEGSVARQQALGQADAVVGRLIAAGLVVVLDTPKPTFGSPPFRCADWFNRHNPVCKAGFAEPREFMQTLRRPGLEVLAELQKRHPKLIVWDTFPVLCPGDPCRAFDDGQPLFFDGDHLSGHANRRLYPHLRRLLVSRGVLDAPKATFLVPLTQRSP